jgi:hypothetical protein
VLAEEGRKPEGLFDFVQGITAVERDKTHQDAARPGGAGQEAARPGSLTHGNAEMRNGAFPPRAFPSFLIVGFAALPSE